MIPKPVTNSVDSINIYIYSKCRQMMFKISAKIRYMEFYDLTFACRISSLVDGSMA